MLFPICEALTRDVEVDAWPLRAMQVHLALLYLISFPLKIFVHGRLGGSWVDGTAVYYGMMATSYPRWPGLEIFAWHDAIVSRAFTWGTLGVEAVAPILIWFRRPRVVCWLALVGLHAGLALFLEGVMMFNVATVCGLLLFLPPRRTRELLAGWLVAGKPRVRILDYVLGGNRSLGV